MGNEYMTANDVVNPVFSDISFAFLKDTGWYDVDYTKAETFNYGRNEGCTFLTSDCYDSGGEPTSPVFCKPPTDGTVAWGCSANYIAIGYCTAYTTSDNPNSFIIDSTDWDYHGGLISSDPYGDNCHEPRY